MEKFADIIEKIENQKIIDPPDNLVNQVMVGAKKVESGFSYKFNRFLFQPRELSSDAVSILSGKIISHRQCSFLLFIIGLFYLLMGLFVIWGMKDFLSQSNINLWLRFQPYLSVLSAVLIISMAVMVSQKPPTIIFAQYGIIAHTAFIVVNAFVLEFMLFSPPAIVFALVLTAAAIWFGVLLISSIRSFIKFGLLTTRSDCA
jgi:membrane-associated HD superfamily phosphohydrolase